MADVDVTNLINANKMKKTYIISLILLLSINGFSQKKEESKDQGYKKRVLETAEIDILAGFYTQNGDNAAVTGGKGTEKLTDVNPTIVIAVPLNDDDILTIDAAISAYTSASSSNIDPFDGSKKADPFVASSGASSGDVWTNVTVGYSHSSDNRNKIWSTKMSFSNEFDYSSVGAGGSYTWLFNEKNTELSLNGNIFIDTWRPLYPYELRSFASDGSGLNSSLFYQHTITGNTNYNPTFAPFNSKLRNSYSMGVGFSQIVTKRLQIALLMDIVSQSGLLSTPYQRVYFKDVADSYIENFQLADAIEQMPSNRLKIAVGGRLNYFINEKLTLRTFYRYYGDDWGIKSNTASIEIAFKLNDYFTFYPSYRYYDQTAVDYFAPYEMHSSTEKYYTSDYDLSKFSADSYGFGVSYTDMFTKYHIYLLKLKSIDLKFNQYNRNSSFKATSIALGAKFVL